MFKFDYDDVGVNRGFKLYQVILSAVFGIVLTLTVVFWLCVYGDYDNNDMAYNGIEVEAVVTDNVEYVDISSDDESARYVWMCNYEYVSPKNVRYSGRYNYYSSREEAEKHIGDSVKITVNPKNGVSTTRPLEYFIERAGNFNTDLTVACVLSGCLVIASYFFFYRVVYRRVLDKKIVKKFKCYYFNDGVADGEVVNCFGLIWFYVKVKFYDEEGISHEKWAREWFTRREARFLRDKRYIKIVLYKSSYGILEQMPYAEKIKK